MNQIKSAKMQAKHNIKIDPNTEQFFNLLFPEGPGWIEFRPIQDKKQNAFPDKKARRWFSSSKKLMDVYPDMIEYCLDNYLGCFYGVLPRESHGVGSKKHIIPGYACWADLDAKSYEHGWDDIDATLEGLQLQPDVIVESGGGVHLYWFLAQATAPEEIEMVNKGIRDVVGGDHTWGRARVMRMPGSWHVKDPENPIKLKFSHFSPLPKGWAIARLREAYCKPSQPSQGLFSGKNTREHSHECEARVTLEMGDLIAANPKLRDLYHGVGKSSGDCSPSGYDFSFAKEALWLGASESSVADGLSARLTGRGKSRPSDYIWATIGNARDSLAASRARRQESSPGAVQLERHPKGHRNAGEPIKSLTNLVSILQHDPILKGTIRYNDFKCRIEFGDGRIADHHITQLRLMIAKSYQLSYASDMMGDALEYTAHKQKYHPVKSWLSGLVWDGTTRIDTWIRDYAGVPEYPLAGEPKQDGMVDIKGLEAVVDQLWAEAVDAFQDGENWILDRETESILYLSQQRHSQTDTWIEKIDAWLDAPGSSRRKEYHQLSELMEALELQTGQQNRAVIMRLSGLLNGAGWHKQRKNMGKRRVWKWKAPEAKTQENTTATAKQMDQLLRMISRKFMIGAVARILRDGPVKVDTTLILLGAQGVGKSSLFRVLAKNPEWFRDTGLDISIRGGRDTYTKLNGCWIYELAELASTRTRENEAIKAFLSSDTDVYRPAYGRFDIERHRSNVFVGTSNELEILRDPTGARRFWPVTIIGKGA